MQKSDVITLERLNQFKKSVVSCFLPESSFGRLIMLF